MSTAAAIAFVAGTAISLKGTADAASASKERGKIQTASQRNEDVSRNRQAARQARIKRAQIEQAAEGLGTSASSSTGGAVGSLSTQVSENKARLEGQQLTAQAISKQNQNVSDAQVTQAFGGAVSSVASSAFSATGGFDNLFKD
tara:strand:- start:356 stop:787 length:432 start_codon:yes stop_codon:yes gene_type:complete